MAVTKDPAGGNSLVVSVAGPRGPRGDTGPQGPVGPVGPTSPSRYYIDPTDYGAKGDAVSLQQATVSSDRLYVSHSQYSFKTSDIGKTLWSEVGWQDNGAQRTIVAVSNGVAQLDSALPSSGTKSILFGTDDTDAIELALQAASKVMLDVTQLGRGADPSGWGGMALGATVKLNSKGYIVKNTQARFDAGKGGAITIPRHCGLEGAGISQTIIYLAPGNVGHGIANAGAITSGLAGAERLYIGKFTLMGGRGFQGSQCLDGVYFWTSFSNYSNVDNYSFITEIQVYQARRHGFHLRGRGECLFTNLWAINCEQNGFRVPGGGGDYLQDSRFVTCNSGGNGYAGFYLGDIPACEFVGCKSFYNGSSGGTSAANSCNWFLGDGAGHSYRKGAAMFIGCEAQESRGSGWYITGGLYQLSGCLSSDPKRSALGGGTLPSVCAALHLDSNASNNVFDNFYCRASLGIDWGATSENHYGGDYAVYIGQNAYAFTDSRSGPRNNKGTIHTLTPSAYDVSKLGGPGITNRQNGELSVDGNFLPSDWPSSPTITSIVHAGGGNATVTYTAPTTNGGRVVRDYVLQYRLASDTVWTEFSDPMSDATTMSVTGLVADAAYVFKVAAVNANGRGAWSADQNYTHTPTAPQQVPGLAVVVGTTKAWLSWGTPVDGGSALTDYKIEYKLSTEPTVWTEFTHAASTSRSITVTGLTDGSSYDFRVSGVNAIGVGVPSSTYTATPRLELASYESSTLLVALDANVSSSLVAGDTINMESWNDISGRGYHFTQSTTSAKPKKGTRTINSSPAVEFDGSDDRLLNTASALLSTIAVGDVLIMIAFQLDAPAIVNGAQSYLLGDNGTSAFLMAMRASSGQSDLVGKVSAGGDSSAAWAKDTLPHIAMLRRSSGTLKVYVDGAAPITTLSSSADGVPPAITLGCLHSSYGFVDGAMAKVYMYDGAGTVSEANSRASAIASAIGTTWTPIT